MNYFYLCSYPIEAGSVILPGNWGRILQFYPLINQNNWWLLLREMVFENIRLNEFSKLPSRLNSIFLCKDYNNIVDFKNKTGRILDLIYEVELLDGKALMHKACLSVFDQEKDGDLRTLEEKARIYWSGKDIKRLEIVTTSSIRIISQHKA